MLFEVHFDPLYALPVPIEFDHGDFDISDSEDAYYYYYDFDGRDYALEVTGNGEYRIYDAYFWRPRRHSSPR